MRCAGPTLLVTLALAASLAACGGDDTDGTSTSATRPSAAETSPDAGSPDVSRPEDDSSPEEETDDSGPSLTPDERAAVRAVRSYVDALDARDGEAVCALVAPGELDAVELPETRGDCAASLTASIGYRDPRGLPVWKTARVVAVPSVDVEGDEVQVVATTVTEFADRDEPSIEDDVVYLVRSGDEWLIAKPSSTLYRAIGVADVPPSVLAPPD